MYIIYILYYIILYINTINPILGLCSSKPIYTSSTKGGPVYRGPSGMIIRLGTTSDR